jgi:dihydrofolate reductase
VIRAGHPHHVRFARVLPGRVACLWGRADDWDVPLRRRKYKTMVAWENPPDLREQPPFVHGLRGHLAGGRQIVYSKTLTAVSSARTRIAREFDADAVCQLKAKTSRDLTIGAPGIAAQAIDAGLVDEYQLFLVPVIVGGGKRFLPEEAGVNLELLNERRFGNGTVYVHYRTRS